ncbi:iron-containing alcohol dehydrogenase [Advenella mimigardefordensis]|uniref:Putative iron-containing alcohol dehydrogenase n=1 Tax=Advenella mimigardefordensis (strain DSM 17166 / LMG 22922 / DPN7) TaxID=1247726 RepID=W0PI47_ADVMD|nr:iron-containing alcohol dehydrogenase [Advenella mimigardefordensis]AHG65115.1 putative iron-containing alcohol dehydrogenase [Advenella mimigardefordensis DPN7]
MNIDDHLFFCAPSRLIIREGARHDLPALLAKLGYHNGILVTDHYFAEHTPWVNEYVQAARQCGINTFVYSGGEPDPSTTLCDQATRQILAQTKGQTPDHVIALGGGSNMDLAKALTLTLRSNKPVACYKDGIGEDEPLPFIAMPTTSGTASEVTPGAILIDPDNATKIALMDNRLRPFIALVDPAFTYTCPPRVTADAGIDALIHAIESYVTMDSKQFERNNNPDPGYSGRTHLSQMFARESMILCARHLRQAYQNGADTQARIGMSYASVFAGLSYGSAGLNAVHGIAYSIAGLTHETHGRTNAVILPYVLYELRDARAQELKDIAAIFGATESGQDTILQLAQKLQTLVSELGIPNNLKDFGIKESDLPRLYTDAMDVTRLRNAFPVPDTSASYLRIIANAWAGDFSDTPNAVLQQAQENLVAYE